MSIEGRNDNRSFNIPNGKTRLLTKNWLGVNMEPSTPLNITTVKFYKTDGTADTSSGVRVIYTGQNSAGFWRTTSGNPSGVGTGSSALRISPQISLTEFQTANFIIKF